MDRSGRARPWDFGSFTDLDPSGRYDAGTSAEGLFSVEPALACRNRRAVSWATGLAAYFATRNFASDVPIELNTEAVWLAEVTM